MEEQGRAVGETQLSFERIAEMVLGTTGGLKKLEESSSALLENSEKLTEVTSNLSAIAEENAASTEESSASVEEMSAGIQEVASASNALNGISLELQEIVNRFKS